MFPYRRHGGAKKRAKSGPMRNKGRGGHRPLPNSARELLPLLQPATKALAQVLAGHSRASGQLNHARNLLMHAERLVAERGHNRLNPAEREEFFEQLARLKLTLADADAEAEAEVPEDQAPQQPVAPPVARERLLEMALALGTSDREPPYGSPRAVAAQNEGGTSRQDTGAGASAPATSDREAPSPGVGAGPRQATHGTAGRDAAGPGTRSDAETELQPGPRSGKRSERLVLMARRPSGVEPNGDGAPGREAATSPAPAETDAAAADAAPPQATEEDAAESRTPRRRRKTTQQGLPEGWVVDEEGFVVPGHG